METQDFLMMIIIIIFLSFFINFMNTLYRQKKQIRENFINSF